jgi:hypothetical protein
MPQFVFFVKLFLTITVTGFVLALLLLSGYSAEMALFVSVAFGMLIAIDTTMTTFSIEQRKP